MRRTSSLSLPALALACSAGAACADVATSGPIGTNLAADLLASLHGAGARTCLSVLAFEVASERVSTCNLDEQAGAAVLVLDYQTLAVGPREELAAGMAPNAGGGRLPFTVLDSDIRRSISAGSLAASFLVPGGSLWQGVAADARGLAGASVLAAPAIDFVRSSPVDLGPGVSALDSTSFDFRLPASAGSASTLTP